MISTWSCWIKSSGHSENNGQKELFSLPNPYSLCHICISTKRPYTCRGNGILYGESVHIVSFCTCRLHKILHTFYFYLRVKDFEWKWGKWWLSRWWSLSISFFVSLLSKNNFPPVNSRLESVLKECLTGGVLKKGHQFYISFPRFFVPKVFWYWWKYFWFYSLFSYLVYLQKLKKMNKNESLYQIKGSLDRSFYNRIFATFHFSVFCGLL